MPLHRFVDAIPQLQPRLQTFHRRLPRPLPVGVVAAAEGPEEAVRHRAVFVAVRADVAVQILLEVFQAAPGLQVQLANDALKERGSRSSRPNVNVEEIAPRLSPARMANVRRTKGRTQLRSKSSPGGRALLPSTGVAMCHEVLHE